MVARGEIVEMVEMATIINSEPVASRLREVLDEISVALSEQRCIVYEIQEIRTGTLVKEIRISVGLASTRRQIS